MFQRSTLVMAALCSLGFGALLFFTQDVKSKPYLNSDVTAGSYAVATFAGGCFWCMEPPFEKEAGVIEAVSGFTGGKEKDPSYKDVAYGRTSHREAVIVTYDPSVMPYERLLDIFWRSINPTDSGGQFADRGHHYSTAIYTHSAEQKAAATASKSALQASKKFDAAIVSEILDAGQFYRAEESHQDYYKKRTEHYNQYRKGSGRASYLKKTWGYDIGKESAKPKELTPLLKTSKYLIPSDKELKATLSDIQYRVTRKNGTERPFKNTYWDNKEDGIYVDIISGEPLFSSKDKFKSGTGWPSYSKPLVAQNVVEKKDTSHFMTRVEIRSKHADSHLGHVFNDGPKPGGLRYCINSAALRFIKKSELKKEGYGEFVSLFE